MRELDPDVLTGWNVVDFDLAVLDRLARASSACRSRSAAGRGALRLRPVAGARGARQASVPGRVVLDGIQLLRGAFVRMDDYALDTVARAVLGEGKTLAGPRPRGRDPAPVRGGPRALRRTTTAPTPGSCSRSWSGSGSSSWRSSAAGSPACRSTASPPRSPPSTSSTCRRSGGARIVAPSVARRRRERGAAGAAGTCSSRVPGLYTNVLVLDFKSLYPSLIRTFEIDPLNLRPARGRPARTRTRSWRPNGAAFAAAQGILREMLDELLPRREEARARGRHASRARRSRS